MATEVEVNMLPPCNLRKSECYTDDQRLGHVATEKMSNPNGGQRQFHGPGAAE